MGYTMLLVYEKPFMKRINTIKIIANLVWTIGVGMIEYESHYEKEDTVDYYKKLGWVTIWCL